MKNQHLHRDMISMLPESIIVMILTLIPIRDAIRCSVLSRKWRYKWAEISKLVFDPKFFHDCGRCDSLNVINQVLLRHHGPMLEFTLHMPDLIMMPHIEQIIRHLSRNDALKKFTLIALDSRIPFTFYSCRLPSSFYSFRRLTHLHLTDCTLRPPSTFNGFSTLTSLYLSYVIISVEMLVRLVSGCPLLKSFTFLNYGSFIRRGKDKPKFFQLFKCLPVVEHLCLSPFDHLQLKWSLARGGAPRNLTTSLVHLKYLVLSWWRLMDPKQYSLVFVFFRSCPYLEKIKIEINRAWDLLDDEMNDMLELLELQDYWDVRLDHLKEVEIKNHGSSFFDLELLKVILIKSSMLKKVRIKLDSRAEESFYTLEGFLQLPRASPLVEIIVESGKLVDYE